MVGGVWLASVLLACGGMGESTLPATLDAGYELTLDAPKNAPVDTPEVKGGQAQDADIGGEAAAQPLDILDALKAIQGMSASEYNSAVSGCRFFRLAFQQPTNHQIPAGPSFEQRMALIHCSPSAPTILGSTGYELFDETIQWELTAMLGANQLIVEHRFYDQSIPASPTWTDLTIQQAAADHHRIVMAIRPLYTGKWLSTGASKGGMTSVYHRRFYPDDVDGTVAYVAPRIDGVEDARFSPFLEQVGDADCRAKIKTFQREALLRRPAMLTRMADLSAQNNFTYQRLGVEQAFEFAVTELWFLFWQYSDVTECPNIPASTATDDDVFQFLNKISSFEWMADTWLDLFNPYFYQTATQLGAPKQADAHLVDLLKYPGMDAPAAYCLPAWTTVFDPTAIEDIQNWLSREGQRIMFIYGQNDPWSAAPYELGNASDSYRFWVPNGNHGSQLSDLSQPDYAQAQAALERWSGAKPKLSAPAPLVIKAKPHHVRHPL
jgi:hypothetical protein